MENQISNLTLRHQHDIPPQIVVDLGSFILETAKPIADVSPYDTVDSTIPIFTGYYRASHPDNKIYMVLIKVIRADDGAIIYQNFDAVGAEIEFNTCETSESNPEISMTPENNNKSIIFHGRTERGLQVKTIDHHGRKQSLEENYIKIRNITVKKGNDTLFAHTINKNDQNRYRVMIKIETHNNLTISTDLATEKLPV